MRKSWREIPHETRVDPPTVDEVVHNNLNLLSYDNDNNDNVWLTLNTSNLPLAILHPSMSLSKTSSWPPGLRTRRIWELVKEHLRQSSPPPTRWPARPLARAAMSSRAQLCQSSPEKLVAVRVENCATLPRGSLVPQPTKYSGPPLNASAFSTRRGLGSTPSTDWIPGSFARCLQTAPVPLPTLKKCDNGNHLTIPTSNTLPVVPARTLVVKAWAHQSRHFSGFWSNAPFSQDISQYSDRPTLFSRYFSGFWSTHPFFKIFLRILIDPPFSQDISQYSDRPILFSRCFSRFWSNPPFSQQCLLLLGSSELQRLCQGFNHVFRLLRYLSVRIATVATITS